MPKGKLLTGKQMANRYTVRLHCIKETHYTYSKEWCTTETSTHASNKAFMGLYSTNTLSFGQVPNFNLLKTEKYSVVIEVFYSPKLPFIIQVKEIAHVVTKWHSWLEHWSDFIMLKLLNYSLLEKNFEVLLFPSYPFLPPKLYTYHIFAFPYLWTRILAKRQ